MGKLIFPCGCSFTTLDRPENEVLRTEQLRGAELPRLDVDIYSIGHDCPATWELFCRGDTKGVFQLEGHLGRTWAKKVQPATLEDLGALVALLRPGCLKAMSGDPPKSMTQRFVDRKHRLEDVTYYNEALRPILEKTYGVLVYQEQAMKISVALAGFNEQEADVLRKAIGKKKPEIMAKIKDEFVGGCLKLSIVDEEQAREIFSWIQESQRYSFNKCLSPTTVVETPDGLKTLDEVEIGDKVMSPDGYVDVVNKYDNGVKELYEITLESGKTIQCTLDHEFLCSDGKKHRLEEIIALDLLIMCEDSV